MFFSNDKIEEILTVLRNGGTILYPSDTIWGIGGDARSEEVVEKINDIKQRKPDKNGYVILVDSVEMLRRYVGFIHPRIETLLVYHQRPLTVIYDQAIGLASNAIGRDGSVAIRVVRDAFCRALIEQFDAPLISTSANVSGEPFPKNYGEISSDILENVGFVVKYRTDDKEKSEPSVIVRLNADEELDFIRS